MNGNLKIFKELSKSINMKTGFIVTCSKSCTRFHIKKDSVDKIILNSIKELRAFNLFCTNKKG